jgi:circadian clock protein KaiC
MSWSVQKALQCGLRIIDGRVPDEAVEAGTFDLTGLIAIASAIVEKQGVKRIALDGIDALFAISDHPMTLRRESLRILNWLADSHLTALLTMKPERDEEMVGRGYFSLAEYAADGVLRLRTTMFGELARRTLSVVKLRGSSFISGDHSYTISDRGFHVLHSPSRTHTKVQDLVTRLSTGIERLDTMLLGGYRSGTTTLISGLPGTSKTTLGAAFLHAGCMAGEASLFIGFDEPAEQMIVDVSSVGLDLGGCENAELLHAESFAAGSLIGDEHYLAIEAMVDRYAPVRVVIDPVSALEKAGGRDIADATMERLVALFKERGITAIFTAISESTDSEVENTTTRVSTIADTWIHLSFSNRGGERNRTLTIVKSRGTGHSNQMREVLLSGSGIDLADVYSSGGHVLVGTARAQSEQQAEVERAAREESDLRELERMDRDQQDLMRQLEQAHRGLDQLIELRKQLLRRSAVSGRAHSEETDLIHTLRHGDQSP